MPNYLDREAHAEQAVVRKSVDFLLHLLHDYIPDGCIRDAERRLYESFEEGGIELTTKAMRKEYEAWKSTHLEGMPFPPQIR